jgi:farnesyl-diphosphate farnesyltransferase
MSLRDEALEALEQTSRTFFLPIMTLDGELQDAVSSSYLCFRAIDEIEDHPDLESGRKVALLREVSHAMQTSPDHFKPYLETLFEPLECLPEVTRRLGDWASLAPDSVAHRVWDATATMSNRMADWAARDWRIVSQADLDAYTHSVAGSVGLLLSDLWAWHDGTRTNRSEAVAYGRGLQTVNIIRNREEDLARGADFFPDGWGREEMIAYCSAHLDAADCYNASLQHSSALNFCLIPLALARGTLDAIVAGREKLSRSEVKGLVTDCLSRI